MGGRRSARGGRTHGRVLLAATHARMEHARAHRGRTALLLSQVPLQGPQEEQPQVQVRGPGWAGGRAAVALVGRQEVPLPCGCTMRAHRDPRATPCRSTDRRSRSRSRDRKRSSRARSGSPSSGSDVGGYKPRKRQDTPNVAIGEGAGGRRHLPSLSCVCGSCSIVISSYYPPSACATRPHVPSLPRLLPRAGPGTGADPYASYRQATVTHDPQAQVRMWQLQQLQARHMVLEQQAKSAATATSKTQREVYVGGLIPNTVGGQGLRHAVAHIVGPCLALGLWLAALRHSRAVYVHAGAGGGDAHAVQQRAVRAVRQPAHARHGPRHQREHAPGGEHAFWWALARQKLCLLAPTERILSFGFWSSSAAGACAGAPATCKLTCTRAHVRRASTRLWSSATPTWPQQHWRCTSRSSSWAATSRWRGHQATWTRTKPAACAWRQRCAGVRGHARADAGAHAPRRQPLKACSMTRR